MNNPVFGRLVDLAPRDAWLHEERHFTPWLAENIAQLGEAIGIPLELTGTEIAVERFEADILARNPMDGSIVLIENQLEPSDHTHLGQIMTYLVGLKAHTVVWIAPSFREPHRSAISWLNENTSDDFSFFAVRVRVVQIADSPYAPIFEVVEKPNGWERQLAVTRKAAEGASEIGERRRAFWQSYLDRVPSASDWGLKPMAHSSAWVPIPGFGTGAILSLWIGASDCGAFLRGPKGSDSGALIADLAPYAKGLEQELDATFQGSAGRFLWKRAGKGFGNPEDWPSIIDWMEATRVAYLAALARIASSVGGDDPSHQDGL